MNRARSQIEREAERMREKAMVEYVRPGERGWKARGRTWERRHREIATDRSARALAELLETRRHRAQECGTGNKLPEPSPKMATLKPEILKVEAFEPILEISKTVMDATCDELIAAGWGDFKRWLIEDDWQTRRPLTQNGHVKTSKLPIEPPNSQNRTNGGQGLA